MKIRTKIWTLLVTTTLTAVALAQDGGNRKALFGELHMHTHWSFDAYLFTTRATPDDAYEFAKGEPLKHPLGQEYQINRPLDFMAVTDHGIFLGVFARSADPSHPMSKMPIARRLFGPDGKVVGQSYRDIFAEVRVGTDILGVTTPREKLEAWQYVVDAANRHNDPGKFTTFIAYEWTATPDNQNLHRNVIFRGDGAPVSLHRF